MIGKPTTRDQARTNAILSAENSHFAAGEQDTGPNHALAWAGVARAWAAIAETFPHEEAVVDTREGSDLIPVHPDFMTEAHEAIAFKNRMRVDPGYTLMALTDREYRTIMAMRSGQPEAPQKPAVARVGAFGGSGQVRVENHFYAVLMAVVVATIQDQDEDAEGNVLIVHPEDIAATEGKTVTMTPGLDAESRAQWFLRLTDSES